MDQKFQQPYVQHRPPVKSGPPKRPSWLWAAVIALLAIIAIIIPVLWIGQQNKHEPTPAEDQHANKSAFDKTQFSLDDPTSPWVVVNKKRPLNPKSYVPAGLVAPDIPLKGNKNTESMQMRPETAQALEELVSAANAEGVEFTLVSAYRSYETQGVIYDSEVRGFGQEVADKESARPGHSEHQTGWAADLNGTDPECELKACFADTPEGQWLAANAYKYGFIIRYAKDKTDVTGYVYEPWHLRYVGIPLADEMHRTSTETLEEFFNLPPAANY